MRVIILPEIAGMGRWTAAHIAAHIRRHDPSPGRPFVLGLPTGSSPLPTYRELIRLHREEGLSFRRFAMGGTVFWRGGRGWGRWPGEEVAGIWGFPRRGRLRRVGMTFSETAGTGALPGSFLADTDPGERGWFPAKVRGWRAAPPPPNPAHGI